MDANNVTMNCSSDTLTWRLSEFCSHSDNSDALCGGGQRKRNEKVVGSFYRGGANRARRRRISDLSATCRCGVESDSCCFFTRRNEAGSANFVAIHSPFRRRCQRRSRLYTSGFPVCRSFQWRRDSYLGMQRAGHFINFTVSLNSSIIQFSRSLKSGALFVFLQKNH